MFMGCINKTIMKLLLTNGKVSLALMPQIAPRLRMIKCSGPLNSPYRY